MEVHEPPPLLRVGQAGGEEGAENEPRAWSYVFDEQTVPLSGVELIGVAVNTANGRTSVETLVPATGRRETAFHN